MTTITQKNGHHPPLANHRKRPRRTTAVVFVFLASFQRRNNDSVDAFSTSHRSSTLTTITPRVKEPQRILRYRSHPTLDSARPALSNPEKFERVMPFARVMNLSNRNAAPKNNDNDSPANVIDDSSSSNVNNINNKRNYNNNPLESSAGFFFGLTIILALGLSNTPDNQSFLGFSVNSDNELNEVALATATRVIDASVPTSSSGYLAAALGESIGGVIGAAFSVLINVLLRPSMMSRSLKKTNEEDDNDTDGAISLRNLSNIRQQPVVSQALSDGDYFIANSATDSLLVAIGVAPEVAKLCSIFIAAIPSQLVKIGPRLREQQSQEEKLLQQLLQEEQKLNQQRKLHRASQQNGLLSMLPAFASPAKKNKSESTAFTSVDPSLLIPVTATVEIDLVEVFADVTRWLEYDVLKNEFAGAVQWNNEILNPSMTGALLGLLAAISSRAYADVLYGRFRYGPKAKQEEVLKRRSVEWASLYFSTAASAATLFGIFELSQLPIFRWVQGTLAGGVEGCIGSSSFDACLQTYIDTNAPGPSGEAQFRALMTNLNMVVQRLQLIAVDTSADDVAALVRAWAVSFVSYWHQLTASLPPVDDFSSTTMLLSNQVQ